MAQPQEEFQFNLTSSDKWKGIFVLHLGGKNTGKSTYTAKYIKKCLKRGKGVLVYDPIGHPYFKDVKLLQIDDLDYWNNKGIVKVNDDDVWRFVEKVFHRVRNTLVVFDDSTPYFQGNLPRIMQKITLQSRNHCNDYFVNMHDFTRAAPALFAYSDIVVLRDTYEDPDELPIKCGKPKLFAKYLKDIQEENRLLYPRKRGKQVPQLAFREIDKELPYQKKKIIIPNGDI